MPKVGGKKFPYNPAGEAAAAREAARTGKPLEIQPPGRALPPKGKAPAPPARKKR
jgi:hypothetical protein